VFKDILALKERIEREKMPTFHARRQANAQVLMRSLYQTPMVSIKPSPILSKPKPTPLLR
jgi:hypothetical protein